MKNVGGIPIDELPEKYQNYTEQIETLRTYGIGMEKESVEEEVIEWLEAHNGKLPRGTIKKQGKRLKVSDMTEEEKREVKLYQRWEKSTLREALKACERDTNRRITRRICAVQRTNCYTKKI